MFSFKVPPQQQQHASQQNSNFTLDKIVSVLRAHRDKLQQARIQVEPRLYDAYLHHRESSHKQVPRDTGSLFSNEQVLYPGTWYLKSIDDKHRREYARVPTSTPFDANNAKKTVLEQLAKLVTV